MKRESDQQHATPQDEQIGWLCHHADGGRHFIWKDRNEAEEMAWIRKRYVRWEPLFVRSESGAFGLPKPYPVPEGYLLVDAKSFLIIMSVITPEQQREICMKEGERLFIDAKPGEAFGG